MALPDLGSIGTSARLPRPELGGCLFGGLFLVLGSSYWAWSAWASPRTTRHTRRD